MTEIQMATGLPPVHPGEILREDVLPALGHSKVEVARALGVARASLYNVLDGKASISPDMAVRLGKLLGNGGGFWLRLQANYDLKLAERRLAEDLAQIPTWEADAA